MLIDYNPTQKVYMAQLHKKSTLTECNKIIDYDIAHENDYKVTSSLYDVSYKKVMNRSMSDLTRKHHQ